MTATSHGEETVPLFHVLVEHPSPIGQCPLFRLEPIQLFHLLDRSPLEFQVKSFRDLPLDRFRLNVLLGHLRHDVKRLILGQILVILIITGHHDNLVRIRGPRMNPSVHIFRRDL